MKTNHLYAGAMLFLVAGTLHAQLTETMPGRFTDLDTVIVTPQMKWFVDSFCVAMEIKTHDTLLAQYKRIPERYFISLSKRLQVDPPYTREQLVANEQRILSDAWKKFDIYRKAYTATLAIK